MKLKKVLAATLATTMIFAMAVTASATGSSTGSTVGSTTSSSTSSSSSSDDSDSSSSSSDSTSSNVVSASTTVTVGGTATKTTVGGTYAATSVSGMAVKTDLATVKASLGLTGSQTPVVTIYDTDAKKSTKAMDSINAAVNAIGGEYVTALNIDLSAMSNGKKVTLSNGSIAMSAGLPKSADATKTYSVVCVQSGGVITYLEDQDTDPKTVTFEVKAGLGTYAIVAGAAPVVTTATTEETVETEAVAE